MIFGYIDGVGHTSAISVAIIAASANKYKVMVSHFGKCFRQFSAKFRPVTLPSLIQRDCKKMANRFDIKMIKRCL